MAKETKWHVRQTQISLIIRPVWSEFSLSVWRRLGSKATHLVQREDSDKTGRMLRLIWVFAGRRGLFCLFFVFWLNFSHISSFLDHSKADKMHVCPEKTQITCTWKSRIIVIEGYCMVVTCEGPWTLHVVSGDWSACDDVQGIRVFAACIWARPWENVSYHMRTTKAQISQRIRAIWSAPLLFAA